MTKPIKIGLILLFAVAVSAPFIATEKPWYVSYHNHNLFPAFSFKKQINIDNTIISYDENDWKQLNAAQIVYAPVPWSPGKSDFENAGYINPFGEQFFRDKQN